MSKFLGLEPDTREAKPNWSDVPLSLVTEIEIILKSKIIKSEIVWGGYSPSASFHVILENKEEYFIKGTHPGQTAHGAEMMRQEISAYNNIPYLKGISSHYIDSVSLGGEKDWLLGIWKFIEGAEKCRPWTKDKITKIIRTLANLHQNTEYKDIKEHVSKACETNHVSDFVLGTAGWRKFTSIDKKNNFCALFENPDQGYAWLEEILPIFKNALDHLPNIKIKESLLHFDLRSDNILFDAKGDVRLLDWPDICWGPILFDLVGFFPSVQGESDLNCIDLMRIYQDISGLSFDEEDQFAVLASISGYFADNAYRNVPPALPRLRWIQKLQLDSCLDWAYKLGRIPQHPPLQLT